MAPRIGLSLDTIAWDALAIRYGVPALSALAVLLVGIWLARGLSLVLRSEDGVVEAYPATGDFDRAATLKVLFEHPSDSSLDVTVLLAPTPTGWRAEAAVPAGHHWNLSAADAAGTWRLKGRMDKAGHAARLAPALRTES